MVSQLLGASLGVIGGGYGASLLGGGRGLSTMGAAIGGVGGLVSSLSPETKAAIGLSKLDPFTAAKRAFAETPGIGTLFALDQAGGIDIDRTLRALNPVSHLDKILPVATGMYFNRQMKMASLGKTASLAKMGKLPLGLNYLVGGGAEKTTQNWFKYLNNRRRGFGPNLSRMMSERTVTTGKGIGFGWGALVGNAMGFGPVGTALSGIAGSTVVNKGGLGAIFGRLAGMDVKSPAARRLQKVLQTGGSVLGADMASGPGMLLGKFGPMGMVEGIERTAASITGFDLAGPKSPLAQLMKEQGRINELSSPLKSKAGPRSVFVSKKGRYTLPDTSVQWSPKGVSQVGAFGADEIDLYYRGMVKAPTDAARLRAAQKLEDIAWGRLVDQGGNMVGPTASGWKKRWAMGRRGKYGKVKDRLMQALVERPGQLSDDIISMLSPEMISSLKILPTNMAELQKLGLKPRDIMNRYTGTEARKWLSDFGKEVLGKDPHLDVLAKFDVRSRRGIDKYKKVLGKVMTDKRSQWATKTVGEGLIDNYVDKLKMFRNMKWVGRIGTYTTVATIGFSLGKSAFSAAQNVLNKSAGLLEQITKHEFGSGQAINTEQATTERQRSLRAIQSSHLAARNLLGGEAGYMHQSVA